MGKSSFSKWFEISLVSIIMAIYLYAAFSEAHNFVEWFIRDDAYFYFKVAQNISEGHGSTLDRINLANGYHPLWMLVCIPIFSLARFDLILPLRVMVVLSGLISAGTGVLLFRLVKRTLSAPAAVLAAVYWVFDYSIHYNVTMFGLETGITALTMTALLLGLSRLPSLRGANEVSDEAIPATERRLLPGAARQGKCRRENHPPRNDSVIILAILAVAMTFSRLDTIFLALLAGAWILLRGTAMRTRLFLDAAVIVCAAFVSVAVRAGLPTYFEYARSAVIFAALGLAIQIPIFYLFGLYRPITNLQSPISNDQSPISNLQLLITNYQLLITNYQLRFLAASLLGSALTASLMIGLLTGGALPGLPRSALLIYAGITLLGTKIAREVTNAYPREIPPNWKKVFQDGIQYYGILGGAVGAYMLFNKWMFGTFTPVSGQVKAWWGSLQGTTYGNPITTLTGFLGLERAEGQNAWGPVTYLVHNIADWLGISAWLVVGLFLVGVTLILLAQYERSKRAVILMSLPLLLTTSLVQMFYYNGQGYAGSKDWYWVSQMLMFALLGALLFDLLTRPIRRFKFSSPNTEKAPGGAARPPSPIIGRGAGGEGQPPSPRGRGVRGEGITWLIASIIALAYLANFATVIVRRMPYGTQRAGQPYLDVVPFLETNTEEGALIGMTGGGNVAYFIQGRAIVNMDGLINSYEYFLALRAGRADEYLASIGLDYIFSNPDILQNAPYNGQFDEWSLKVSEFGKKDLLKYEP